MPLTPRFALTQTETQVLVTIYVPTVRVTNIEVLLEESTSTFHFHASPYLLKLHFAPNEFAEDSHGNIPAEYDPSNQKVCVRLNKAEAATWPNLDLTARLMQPKEISKQWLVAVEDGNDHVTDTKDDELEDRAQPQSASAVSSSFTVGRGYGFCGIFKNIFTDYCRGGLAQEMLQLPDPEATCAEDRRLSRIEKENDDFDEERYLQDLYIEEDYLYPMVMEFLPWWRRKESVQNAADDDIPTRLNEMTLGEGSPGNRVCFTSDERLQLATIPYPLIPKDLIDLYSQSTFWVRLLDIIVPYIYDNLTTCGEPTVESAWTITIMSPSLSWLDEPTMLNESVQALTRRMIIYPYWRNFDFAMMVWKQTMELLESGIHAVIKALLTTRTILEKSESYYVSNKIFVDPILYCIQQMGDDRVPRDFIESLSKELSLPSRLKTNLELGLVEIEKLHRGYDSEESEDEVSSHESDDDGDDDSDDDDNSSSSRSSTKSNEDASPSGCDGPLETVSNPRSSSVQREEILLDSLVGDTRTMLSIVDCKESSAEEEEGATTPDKAPKSSPVRKGPLIQEL